MLRFLYRRLLFAAVIGFLLVPTRASSQEVDVTGPGPILVPPLSEPLDPSVVQINLGNAGADASVEFDDSDLGIKVSTLTNASGQSHVELPAGQHYKVQILGGSPPPPPQPPPLPPLPIVYCGHVVSVDQLANYLKDAAKMMKAGKKLSGGFARALLGEGETETCILEPTLPLIAQHYLRIYEDELIQAAFGEIEDFLVDNVRNSPLPRQWSLPVQPFPEEYSRQEAVVKMLVIGEDEKFIRHVKQQARRDTAATQLLTPIHDSRSGGPGLQLHGCNSSYACGQLINIGQSGWVSAGQ